MVRPQIRFPLVATLVTLLAVLLLAACNEDIQRIDDANDAARLSGPPAESTAASSSTIQRSGEISIFDVRDGDCFNSLNYGLDIETVEIIPCSGDWETRVVSSFLVDSVVELPEYSFFWRQAVDRCDRRYSSLMYPLLESWNLGDRVVNCLQESYGLGLAEIDALVSINTLMAGECFNEAPETGFLSVEVVDCDGDWEFQALTRFEVPNNDQFPGVAYVDAQVELRCAAETEFVYSPNSDSWDVEGDRLVICSRGK
jgi:hypothetical protein